MSGGKVVLYSYWRSSCSWRVRIALNLKQIEFTIVPVNLLKQEQVAEEFAKLNPMEKVPALRIDDMTLVESYNIINYLEETRPGLPLLPKDIKERVRVRTLCDIICSGIQPLQNVGLLKKVGDGKVEWAQHWISKGFKALESLMAEWSGEYCVGDSLSMADCFLVPQVYNARRFEVDFKPYPNIVRVEKKLSSLPAFQESHPSKQPDAVE